MFYSNPLLIKFIQDTVYYNIKTTVHIPFRYAFTNSPCTNCRRRRRCRCFCVCIFFRPFVSLVISFL